MNYNTTEQQTALKPQTKVLYYEIIRIIAIFCVLFNHSGTLGFQLYSITDNKYTFPIYLICAILCKVGVPLFLMVSGALLLGKEESVKVLYKKRVLRMVIALVVFSLLAYLKINKSFSVKGFLMGLVEGNISPAPYWYLYGYICYLLMLPILRRIVYKCNFYNMYKYFVVMGTIFLVAVPAIKYIFDIKLYSYISLPICSQFIIYPVMGYLIANIDLNKKSKCLLFVMSVLSIAASYALTLKSMKIDKMSQFGTNEFVFFTAILVFVICKDLGKHIKANGITGKTIMIIGSGVFGTYLLEPIFVRSIMYKVAFKIMNYLPCIISVGIGCICAVVSGVLITLVLKKIPYIKKIL